MPHIKQFIMAKTKYNLHLKGYVGGWDFDSDYVDFILNKNTDKEVSVLIDSLGGNLSTALSISSAFRRHGNVHAHFVGMNASAATVASMGAKHISMDRSAMYLVHQCSQAFFEWGSLNATDMQNLIDNLTKQKNDLDKIDANIAAIYANRCKKKSADLLALMKQGGWLSAQEALEWGFVDELTEFDDEDAPVITEAVVADCTAHGIPLPKGIENKEKADDISAFKRFMLALSAAFHSNSKDNCNNNTEAFDVTDTNNANDINNSNNSSTLMNKTFKYICAILGCEALASGNDAFSLSSAQLDTIEDAIKKREESIDNLKKQVEDLTNANNSLLEKVNKLPADSTNNVVDNKSGTNSEKSDIERFYDTTNSAKALFDSLP